MTLEEPTPPAPLPEGKGEKSQESPPTSDGVQEAKPAVTPFPSGRGAGGVGSSLRRRKWLVVAFVAFVAFVAVVWPYLSEPKDDFGRFQGEWQLLVPVVDRENKPAARATPVTIRVIGDRWVLTANGQERGRYAMTLRPEAKEIDLAQLGPDDKPTGLRSRGVYTIDRDRATVAHAPEPDPRPTDPSASDGTVWLLERVK